MILFKDKFTGDELFTDAYRVVEEKTYFKFTGKQTLRKEGQVDDCLIGANASAEEPKEQTEESVTSGLDFALTAQLNEISFNKKDLQVYLKDYFKRLQEKCVPKDCEDHDSKLHEFKEDAQEFAKFVLANHKDLCFYFGASDYSGENCCCFVKWLNEKEAEVYAFKGALEQQKC